MKPGSRIVAAALMLRNNPVMYCLKSVAQLFNYPTKTDAFLLSKELTFSSIMV